MRGWGNTAGAYFEDLNSSGYGYVGNGHFGVRGWGNDSGGVFSDLDGVGYAFVGHSNHGVRAWGSQAGGYFEDTDTGSYCNVGSNNTGISCNGSINGGYFAAAGQWAYAASAGYKIQGTGTVSFVQNHPERSDRVIVYHAPESSEVAVYTRGSARLVDGRALIELDPTFRWVTNPDLGLTAHLTPIAEPVALATESVSTSELAVRGPVGSNVAFTYLVYGLRIGFEELPPVQEKQVESKIPVPELHETYAKDPSLIVYSARERFLAMETAHENRRTIGTSGASTLIEAIGRIPTNNDGGRSHPTDEPDMALARSAAESTGTSEHSDETAVQTIEQGAAQALSLNVWLPVSDVVEAGDVLALDPGSSGRLRRAENIADPMVFGVAIAVSERLGDGLLAAVATHGLAEVRVDAGFGPVRAGDLLVSSPTPGHAMRATEVRPGTVLGKAFEDLDSGTATIRMLVSSR